MPAQFKYKAISEAGKHEHGVISAIGPAQVEEYLRENNLLPIRITAVRKINALSFLGFLRGNLYEQLIMFTNSLSTMYKAGIPLLRALSIIRIGKTDSHFNHVLDQVRTQIQGGKSLSESMRDHGDVFSDVYVSCVAAGEESGQLEHTLDELSSMLEQEMELNRQIKSAVRYPAVVILIMIGAFFVLMSYVIPQFVEFYSSFDAELPLATRIIIGISNAVVNYWPLVLLLLVALGFMYKQLVGNIKGRLWHDRQLLRIPVIGSLVIKGNVARFCLMFRILFESGLPLIKSLSVINQTIKNAAIGSEITQLEDIFRRGQDADILAGGFQYIPDLTLHMISIGLESGDLGGMLKEVGDHYSKQVRYTSQNLTAIIEPILTVVLGGFVLILALAIFLPMWNLIKVFSG